MLRPRAGKLGAAGSGVDPPDVVVVVAVALHVLGRLVALAAAAVAGAGEALEDAVDDGAAAVVDAAAVAAVAGGRLGLGIGGQLVPLQGLDALVILGRDGLPHLGLGLLCVAVGHGPSPLQVSVLAAPAQGPRGPPLLEPGRVDVLALDALLQGLGERLAADLLDGGDRELGAPAIPECLQQLVAAQAACDALKGVGEAGLDAGLFDVQVGHVDLLSRVYFGSECSSPSSVSGGCRTQTGWPVRVSITSTKPPRT